MVIVCTQTSLPRAYLGTNVIGKKISKYGSHGTVMVYNAIILIASYKARQNARVSNLIKAISRFIYIEPIADWVCMVVGDGEPN